MQLSRCILLCLCLAASLELAAQGPEVDSLIRKLPTVKGKSRAEFLVGIAKAYYLATLRPDKWNKDSMIMMAGKYGRMAEEEARKWNDNLIIGNALNIQGIVHQNSRVANMNEAIRHFSMAAEYFARTSYPERLGVAYSNLGSSYHTIGDIEQAIIYYDSSANAFMRAKDTATSISEKIWVSHCLFDKGDYRRSYDLGVLYSKEAKKTNDTLLILLSFANLTGLFNEAGLGDLALEQWRQTLQYYPVRPKDPFEVPFFVSWSARHAAETYIRTGLLDSAAELSSYIPMDSSVDDNLLYYGKVYRAKGKIDSAEAAVLKSFEVARNGGHVIGVSRAANELAEIYESKGKMDEALRYAQISYDYADRMHALLEKKNAAGVLSSLYEQKKDYARALEFNKLYRNLSDSVASEDYKRQLVLYDIRSELDNQKQLAQLLEKENELSAQKLQRERLLRWSFLGAMASLVVVILLVIRNNRHKQESNRQLQEKNNQIESTLEQLKQAQDQLIHAEKMASLGQLTAGIAHEIQNPLNFVNNFSELSLELVDDLKNDPRAADALIPELRANILKISEHGKRADKIVKSMLQHSRAKAQQKVETALAPLLTEAVRLAKREWELTHQGSDIEILTEIPPDLGKAQLVPQEISRVVVNLVNNALYAVAEKQKQLGKAFKPIVRVSAKREGTGICLEIEDNGIGINEQDLKKIFHPFYTTKPTGEGTGLGLSLSYDIITKGHGGKLDVRSVPGSGTVFTIELPA